MTTWSLQGRSLKLNSANDIEPHLKDLSDSTEEAILSGNTLGVEAAQALAKALPKCTSLKKLDLSDIFTGRLITEIPAALKALCDALIGLPNLQEVDLSDNAFGGRSVEPMVAYLSSSHATLKVLRLSNNGMGPEGGAVIAQALITSAETAQKEGKSPALERVICGRNRLENGSAETWAKAFSLHAASLKEVRLYQNGIRMQGIAALAKGLASCSKLEVLDLQDNTATQLGSRALADNLPKWIQLKELNLSDCLLRSKGSRRILSVLASGQHSALSHLKLQSNEIDAPAIEELVKGIKGGNLKALEAIELNGNRVGEEDGVIVELIQALEDVNGVDSGLDELDDVEEVDPDESGDEEEASASEDELVKEDQKAELSAPTITPSRAEDDDLATAMSSIHLNK